MPPPKLALAKPLSGDQDPVPPPVSPITPLLSPLQLAESTARQRLPPPASRPRLTHSQPDQLAIQPPPPEPIDFESNPDVLALKSAISVLQLQKQRATADIQALSRAKETALADSDAFVADLVDGKVTTGGGNSGREAGRGSRQRPREWSSLPAPQDVVRCPPINWAQYAVVGPSLDKLHAEQIARPSQGSPASVSANGSYEFKDGFDTQEDYRGVAAPYAPGKDRIERKSRSKR